MKYYSVDVFGFKINTPITSSLIGNLRKFARWTSYLICILMLAFIIVDHDTTDQ